MGVVGTRRREAIGVHLHFDSFFFRQRDSLFHFLSRLRYIYHCDAHSKIPASSGIQIMQTRNYSCNGIQSLVPLFCDLPSVLLLLLLLLEVPILPFIFFASSFLYIHALSLSASRRLCDALASISKWCHSSYATHLIGRAQRRCAHGGLRQSDGFVIYWIGLKGNGSSSSSSRIIGQQRPIHSYGSLLGRCAVYMYTLREDLKENHKIQRTHHIQQLTEISVGSQIVAQLR